MSNLLANLDFGVEESIESYRSADGPSNESSCSNSPEGDGSNAVLSLSGNDCTIPSIQPQALGPAVGQSDDYIECLCEHCSDGKILQIYDDPEEFPDSPTGSEKKLKVVSSYYSYLKIADGPTSGSDNRSPTWLGPSEPEIRDRKPTWLLDLGRGSKRSPISEGKVLVKSIEVKSEDCIYQGSRSFNASGVTENSNAFCCSNGCDTKSVVAGPYVMAVRESFERCQSTGNALSVNRTRSSSYKTQENCSSEISHIPSSDMLELISASTSRVKSEGSNTDQVQTIAPPGNFRPASSSKACISPSTVTSSSTSAACTCPLQDKPAWISKESEILGSTALNSSGAKRFASILNLNGDSGIVCRTIDSEELPAVPKEDSPPLTDRVVDGPAGNSVLLDSIGAASLKESSDSYRNNRRKRCSQSLLKSEVSSAQIESSAVKNSKLEQSSAQQIDKSNPSGKEVLPRLGSTVRTSRSVSRTSVRSSISPKIQESNSTISPRPSEMLETISRSAIQKEESKNLCAPRPQIATSLDPSAVSPASSSGSAMNSTNTSAGCTCVPQNASEPESIPKTANWTGSKVIRSQLSLNVSSGCRFHTDSSKKLASRYSKEDNTQPDASVSTPDSVGSITLAGSSESLMKLGKNRSGETHNRDGASGITNSQTLKKVDSVQSSISERNARLAAPESCYSSTNQNATLERPTNTGTEERLEMNEPSSSGSLKEKLDHSQKLDQSQKLPGVRTQNFGKSTRSGSTTLDNSMQSSKSDTSVRSMTQSSRSSSDFSSCPRGQKAVVAGESPKEITQLSVGLFPSKILPASGTDLQIVSGPEDTSQLANSSTTCNLTSDDEKSRASDWLISDANNKFGAQYATDCSYPNFQGLSSASDSPVSFSPLASWTTPEKFRDQMELSTLLSLAFVRVCDLTKAIDRAREYLSNSDSTEPDNVEDELRGKIEKMFESRADLSLERAKWRCEFSTHYGQRRQVLADLKAQSDDLVDKNLELRQQVSNLAEEPSVMKPKKSLLKKLFSCGLVN